MVHLTVDTVWKQITIDYKHDEEQWFNETENLPNLICNCSFDEHGNCAHTNNVEINIQHLEYISDNKNKTIDDNQILCVAYPHEMFDSQSVFQSTQT